MGALWSPWPHSPAVSILPTMSARHMHHGRALLSIPGDSSGHPRHPDHLDPLLQAAGWSLGSHQHPDLMCKSAARKGKQLVND